MPFTKILSSHLSFVVSPKSRLRTTTLFRLQRGKMRKNVSMRFLRWFMVNVLTVWFSSTPEEDHSGRLLADEQFLSSFSENLLHPLSLLLIMTMYQRALMQQSISSKRMQTNCLYRGTKRLFVTQDRLTGYASRHSNNTDFRLIPT